MKKDYLYNIALKCAELNNNGCALGCAQCQFNVFNYVSDIREASLLKANAYTDYFNRQKIEQDYKDNLEANTLGALLIFVIFIGLLVGTCSGIKSCFSPGDLLPDQREEIQYLAANRNNPENIIRILALMKDIEIPDWNEDGKIDCIDYSITFRMLYGSNARLIINDNPRTGMNHMFIIVRTTGSSVHIEPQGTPQRYAMAAVWGMKYDSFYNKDVTILWSPWIN